MKKWYKISSNCSELQEHSGVAFKEMTEDELEKFKDILGGGCSFCHETTIEEVKEDDLVYCKLMKKEIPFYLCYGEKEGEECSFFDDGKAVSAFHTPF